MRGLVAAVAVSACVAGCGLNVELPDLFQITRTGQGTKLTMVVNDSGTLSCNGGKERTISSAMLIQARDLSDDLANDATANLRIAPSSGTLFYFRIRMQQGTIEFPDRAAATHAALAEAELFATQAAQQVCGLGG
ncbi:MAG: hypothetical protein ACLP50_01260 [Solirubrobacteraceae bacterium]|jgi:hypothetical protein